MFSHLERKDERRRRGQGKERRRGGEEDREGEEERTEEDREGEEERTEEDREGEEERTEEESRGENQYQQLLSGYSGGRWASAANTSTHHWLLSVCFSRTQFVRFMTKVQPKKKRKAPESDLALKSGIINIHSLKYLYLNPRLQCSM